MSAKPCDLCVNLQLSRTPTNWVHSVSEFVDISESCGMNAEVAETQRTLKRRRR